MALCLPCLVLLRLLNRRMRLRILVRAAEIVDFAGSRLIWRISMCELDGCVD